MNRRPGAWITSLAALLAVALVAAPVWDAWRYRRLRSPVGSVPVGVILPLRPAPPAPLPARPEPEPSEPAGRPPASTAAAAGATVAPAPVASTAAAPAAFAHAPAAHDRGAVAAVSAPAPGRADRALPAGAPPSARSSVPSRALNPTEPPATEPHTGSGATTAVAPEGSAGWIAVPVSEGAPQPEPEPGQPAPTPTTKQATPSHGGGDPAPTPQAIPTLQLVPPAEAVSVGDSLVVTVRLTGASNVTSLPFHVQFDPAILEFQSAAQGPALGSAMQPILLASVSPARPGDLAVGLSLVDAGGLLQGSGSVIRLQFRALAAGSSPLDFTHATIRGRISEPLDARFQSAIVNVR